MLSDRELNPGLQCDRLVYSPLYICRTLALCNSILALIRTNDKTNFGINYSAL
ncbi:hypothetical protein DL89DRAFT_271778 [Linderina pennispora]|uniref:Uncharacterized protein n=1 Tax=Linderina pennispora TaxID=61395 RepID=A0A1Y1VU85_9FUNG|nr:uncharacterized protein DL89DRAFT_271772 [Linderina pennispora]XP_040739398.1 uncharacterized protein DL89DRAFT_271778 [Linderina pennispora]ORX64868.1 hypothetical protein DL89DRAFT_271772 [Linderina pennispora]ORX64869.1 hypothetical protein DL89DRAFT_271778 [Linderina pennispora]